MRLTKAAAISTLGFLLAACGEVEPEQPVRSDLTIFLDGEILAKGGVIQVDPIPVPEARWREIAGAPPAQPAPPDGLEPIAENGRRWRVAVSDRYAQVQFLYPDDATYAFRFRPAAGANEAGGSFGTSVLTIGGVDMEGKGPAMDGGFAGLQTSGYQIIQVAGPETDESAARVLAGFRSGADPMPLQCTTGGAVSVCLYPAQEWPELMKKWEIGNRDLALEKLRWAALDKCYRDAEWAFKGEGSCELVSGEGETPV